MKLRMRVETSAPLAEVLPLRDGLRRVLPDLASDLARGVRERTLDGRDVAGPGRSPKADGSRSTLRDTGAMVRSFQPVRVTDTGFVLAPARGPERRRAALHQRGAGSRLPRREW